MPWTPAPPIARARRDSVRTDPPSLSGKRLRHATASAVARTPPARIGTAARVIVSMNTWPFENPIAVRESRSAADTRDLTSHHLGQRDQGGDAGDERQQPHPTRLGADRTLHVGSDELARLDAELGRARKWRQLTSQGRFVDARLNPDWDHRQCDADVGAVDQALREDRVRLRVIDRRRALEDADQRRRERELRGVRAEAVLGRALLRERVQIEAIAELRSGGANEGLSRHELVVHALVERATADDADAEGVLAAGKHEGIDCLLDTGRGAGRRHATEHERVGVGTFNPWEHRHSVGQRSLSALLLRDEEVESAAQLRRRPDPAASRCGGHRPPTRSRSRARRRRPQRAADSARASDRSLVRTTYLTALIA